MLLAYHLSLKTCKTLINHLKFAKNTDTRHFLHANIRYMASLPYSRWQKRKKNLPNRSINNVDMFEKAARPASKGVILLHLS